MRVIAEADWPTLTQSSSITGCRKCLSAARDDKRLQFARYAHLYEIVDFVPLAIRVSPNAPRSMQVFAPISTSSSITTMPICGNFTSVSFVADKTEAVSGRSRHRHEELLLPIVQLSSMKTFEWILQFLTTFTLSPIFAPARISVPSAISEFLLHANERVDKNIRAYLRILSTTADG